MKILIAEDDPSLQRVLCAILGKEQYSVDAVSRGDDALDYLKSFSYDAAVLDVMMPGPDGFQVLKEVRRQGICTPILILTARDDVADRVYGLDSGADDYLTKPFDVRELCARLRVLTRREKSGPTSVIAVGGTSLDTSSFELRAGKGSVFLPNKEYQCMLYFMQDPGRVFSPDFLLERIWTPEDEAMENTLWTVIYNLRQKLLSTGSELSIKTRRNQGYSLENKNEE
ncbi:MAG: response regulator transcription factor [Clostridia bacterium]|nr:response regulator transcription factor [Clostridia bacterium]